MEHSPFPSFAMLDILPDVMCGNGEYKGIGGVIQ